MAFPVTSVIDDFTRADAATLGANYTRWVMRDVTDDMRLVSNAAKAPATINVEGAAAYNVSTYGPDCEVWAEIGFINDVAFSNYMWLGLRLQDPGGASTNDGYVAEIESQSGTDVLYVERFDNDVATQLGSTVSQEFANGESLGMEMIGDTLKVYRKASGTWSEVASRTDSTYTGAGNIGLGGVGYTADDGQKPVWNDLGGGSIVPMAAITGTATATIDEADIVAGGKTIIETLSNATFKPAAGTPAYSTGTAKSTTTAPGRTGNGDLTIDFPPGYTPVAGDFALIILYHDQGTGSLPSGGWAEVTGSPFGAGTEKLQIFSKVLAGGESAPVTTISGSGTNISHCANMAIYTGIGSIGAIGTPSNGTGTPMTAGAINTTADNSIVVAASGRGDNENASGQTFNGSATGVVERLDGGTGEGADSQVSMADISIATSGSSSGNASSTTSTVDPWVSVQLELKPSTPFNDARQAIINGLDSAQAEGTGWDAVVKAGLAVTAVVRTSDTVVTITLPAFASYNITAQEVITVTVPAAALVSGGPITGTPTFTVDTFGGVVETLDVGGTITPAGALLKRVNTTPRGTITPAGALAKLVSRLFVGAITPVGALAKQIALATFVGSVDSTGSNANQANKPLGGSVASSGALAKAVSQVLAGVITPAGSLAKLISRSFAGAITSAGDLVNSSQRYLSVSGAINSAGALASQTNKALAGTITSAGSFAPFVFKALSGAVASAGSIVKAVAHVLAGSIASSSSLDNEAQFGSVTETLDVDGSITPTGSIALQVNKNTSGAVTSSGAVQRVTNKNAAGTVTPTGDPNPVASKVLAGSITPTGALTNDVLTGGPETITLTGAVTSTGAVGKFVSRLLVGVVTPVGRLSKFLTHALAGSINAAGSVRQFVSKATSGSITPAGTVDTLLAKVLRGTITPVGSLSRFASRTYAGAVTPTGRVAKIVSISLGGSLSSSGALATAEVGAMIEVGGTITPTGSLTLTSILGTDALIVPIPPDTTIIVSVDPLEALLVDVDIPDVIVVPV